MAPGPLALLPAIALCVLLLAPAPAVGGGGDGADNDWNEFVANVEQITDVSYAELLKGRVGLVMFYAEWCGYCKQLKPVYVEVARHFADRKQSVLVGGVLAQENKNVPGAEHIEGFPTILLFVDGEVVETYSGGRDKDSLVAYIEKMSALDDGSKRGLVLKGRKEMAKKKKLREEEAARRDRQQAEDSDKYNRIVPEITDATFGQHIKAGYPLVLVMYYADWCGHCKAMKGDYTRLAEHFATNSAVRVMRLLASDNRNNPGSEHVEGFPSLLTFKGGQLLEKYEGKRNFNDMREYLDKLARMSDADHEWRRNAYFRIWEENTAKKKEEQRIEEEKLARVSQDYEVVVTALTDANYDDLTAKFQSIFVMFYADWCGHCKKMKPDWLELAHIYSDSASVRVMRCKNTEQNNPATAFVEGFPTIMWIHSGKVVDVYTGGRTLADFKTYVERMSGIGDRKATLMASTLRSDRVSDQAKKRLEEEEKELAARKKKEEDLRRQKLEKRKNSKAKSSKGRGK